MDFAPGCDAAENGSVINDILSTVATAEGVDATDLSPPLHRAVDTDALEQLVQNTERPLFVTFGYRHWRVEVRGGDETEVTIFADDE